MLVFHVTISRLLLTQYQGPSIYVICYIKKIIIKMLVFQSSFKNRLVILERKRKRKKKKGNMHTI